MKKFNIYRETPAKPIHLWRPNVSEADVKTWMKSVAANNVFDRFATAGSLGSDGMSASIYHDAEQILTVYTARVAI